MAERRIHINVCEVPVRDSINGLSGIAGLTQAIQGLAGGGKQLRRARASAHLFLQFPDNRKLVAAQTGRILTRRAHSIVAFVGMEMLVLVAVIVG